ncbi:MAG TPA: undecaprenyl-phosphate galactose phosphotransferase WbaP [Elusimicrobia bacterium]|nr:MAG: hypothetical protein A2016_11350 [Elusimicrobia bacterium GWF2_62_30]HBA61016.1 undecaprenyl-phosphate galactose phosphotransferase WbaP [Elusimicrobiota bacterium]
MTFLPKIKNRIGVALLFLGDILAIFAFFHLSVLIREGILPRFISDMPDYNYSFKNYSWIFVVWLLILLYEEGYSKRLALWDEIRFIWKSSFFSSVAIFTMLFVMKRGHEYSRALIITMAMVAIILFPFVRIYYKRFLYYLGLMRRKILIIGSGPAAVSAYTAIRHEPNLGYEIAGFVDNDPAMEEIDGNKVRKGINKIDRYIRSAGIHDVIVAKPELDKDELAKLLNHLQHKVENTLFIPDIKGIAVAGTELRHFFREQTIIIEVSNTLANPLKYGAKRLLDYLAGVIIFLVFLAPMLLIALIIKLDSKGPAILRQKRIGKNAREFYCFKFRTMLPDADERLKKLLENDRSAKEEWEKYWKLTDDPRITRVGNILRKTSLDELPQILNVILGEMSLIGPRPYLPREWEYIKEESDIIHALPPGITGLWQVSGRNNQDYNFRITMDSWYVKNWNLWLDVMILFETVGVVLKRDGAR